MHLHLHFNQHITALYPQHPTALMAIWPMTRRPTYHSISLATYLEHFVILHHDTRAYGSPLEVPKRTA